MSLPLAPWLLAPYVRKKKDSSRVERFKNHFPYILDSVLLWENARCGPAHIIIKTKPARYRRMYVPESVSLYTPRDIILPMY